MARKQTILFLVTEDWFFCSHRLFLAIEARKRNHRVVVASRFRQHRQKVADHGIEAIDLELSRKGLSPAGLLLEGLAGPLTIERLNALVSRTTYPSRKLSSHIGYKPDRPVPETLAAIVAGWLGPRPQAS